MRVHGKTKLGFFPLPIVEAKRLKNHLSFASECSAIDPCIGDGVAFSALLQGSLARRYGTEIDADRAAQAKALGIEALQANTLDVRCPAESVSLLYLNPPYDWEAGQSGNQRLEQVFLEHTYRWLKLGGVLIFVIPQNRLQPCARSWPNPLPLCACIGLQIQPAFSTTRSQSWEPDENGRTGYATPR